MDEATYQKYRDNTVLISNMNRSNIDPSKHSDGGTTSFTCFKVGRHLSSLFKSSGGVFDECGEMFDVTNIPYGYMFIMCPASEKCLVDDHNIIFVGDGGKSRDYVILLLVISDAGSFLKGDNWPMWDNVEDLKGLKRLKKSTIKTNQPSHHYGSSGLCFSFGVRNGFGMDITNTVSLTTYAGDELEAISYYKHFMVENFSNMFHAFDRVYPGFSYKLHISIESMQYASRDVFLNDYVKCHHKQLESTNPFLLSSNINVDCRTERFHCEKDVTYTSIMVPCQVTGNYIVFEFRLNDEVCIRLKCPPKSCFTYSAYCLSHRQRKTDGQSCLNLSSYCNRSVYCNFRRSWERLTLSDS